MNKKTFRIKNLLEVLVKSIFGPFQPLEAKLEPIRVFHPSNNQKIYKS